MGIITTIAGNGTGGYNGDNIPATSAQIITEGLRMDVYGNIYLADGGNARIRKINTSGIITTIAGNGITGYGGDNGDPLLANLFPIGVAIDKTGNIYIADRNSRIRLVRYNVGISEVALLQPVVYPNPNGGSFTVTLPEAIQGSELTLTDVLGRVVWRIPHAGRETSLSADVPDGVYFLSAVLAEGRGSEKIIIRR